VRRWSGICLLCIAYYLKKCLSCARLLSYVLIQGDEGAAIAQMDDNAGNKDSNNWTLTAIVSRLNYFGREDRPREEVLKMFSVGVKVEPHMGWINYVVNGDSITQSPTVSTTPLYTPSISPTPTGGARNLSILHLCLMVSLLTSSLMLTR